MNRFPDQVHFSGQVHPPLLSDAAARNFAHGLMVKFAKAIPGRDNLIIGWFDGSAKEHDGGIGIIVDVCLPTIPKFSIIKAHPVPSHGSNSVVVELNACTETCYIVKKMLEKCEAKGMLKDIKCGAPLEIILVTDCMSLLNFAQETIRTRSNGDAAERREPLLRRLKTVSDELMNIIPFVKLHFHQCLRNKVERTQRVDRLSKDAREKQKSYRSTVEYSTKVAAHPQLIERAQEVSNKFQRHSEPAHITQLIAELEDCTRKFPTAWLRRRNDMHTTTRRRKFPTMGTNGNRKVTVVEEEENNDDLGERGQAGAPQPAAHRHKRRRVDRKQEVIVLSSDDDEDQNVNDPPVQHIVKRRSIQDESKEHEVIYISSDDGDD